MIAKYKGALVIFRAIAASLPLDTLLGTLQSALQPGKRGRVSGKCSRSDMEGRKFEQMQLALALQKRPSQERAWAKSAGGSQSAQRSGISKDAAFAAPFFLGSLIPCLAPVVDADQARLRAIEHLQRP